MKRFSANLGFLWSGEELLTRIAHAGAAGFPAVELHWPYDVPAADVRRACADAGVRLLALNSPLGDTSAGESGLAALPGRQADFRESFHRAADYAREAGAGRVHVMAGITAFDAAGRAAMAENLRWAEEAAPELTLLLEPLNRHDKPGYFYHLPEQALEIIEGAGLARTRLMFDAYHVGREGLSPEAEYDRAAPHVGHVQFASVPDRREPFGGTVDMARFLAHLAARGYDGWVGCEYLPASTVEDGLPELRAMAEAFDRAAA